MQSVNSLLSSIYERSKRELGEARFSTETVSFLKDLISKKFKLKSPVVILIGGTNGKGSTSLFLNSILTHVGFKVGLFTSPHLITPEERIRILDKNVKGLDFSKALEFIESEARLAYKSGNIGRLPTFFEEIFLVAYYLFNLKGCDICIYEVGLGGRLDATNVLKKDISFITQVSLDHENFLGKSVEEILKEKAGIFVNADFKIVGEESLLKFFSFDEGVIYDRDIFLKEFTNRGGFRYEFKFNFKDVELLFNPVAEGFFQSKNIKNALIILKKLEDILSIKFKREDIENGINSCHIPGRLEKVWEIPRVYVDGAHNMGGFEVIKRELSIASERPFILFGCLKDKNIRFKMKDLFQISKDVAFVKIKNERSMGFREYREILSDREFLFFENSIDGFNWMKKRMSCDDTLLIFGSLYLVGEILSCLM